MPNFGLVVKRFFFIMVAVVLGVVFVVSIAEDALLVIGFGDSESYDHVERKGALVSSLRGATLTLASDNEAGMSSPSELLGALGGNPAIAPPNHSYSEDPQLAIAEALAAKQEAEAEENPTIEERQQPSLEAGSSSPPSGASSSTREQDSSNQRSTQEDKDNAEPKIS
jgi:hypothetical protein